MASNPVFDRIDKESARGYAGFGQAPQGPTDAVSANPAMSQRQLEDMYDQPSAGPVQTGRLTLDDVIMKTATLFGIMLVLAVVAWNLPPGLQEIAVFGGIAVTLALALVIAFTSPPSAPLIVLYAAFEGLVVGAVSAFYGNTFDPVGTPAFRGIVAQAVLGTLAVFVAMLLAYVTGIVKVTDKFRRIMAFALLGYALFALANFGYALVTHTPFGFGGSDTPGFVVSAVAIGLAALMLAIDFDSIDRAIAAGAPQRYSWLLAYGLLVTLVWLYLEILRLLGRMRSN